MDPADRIAEWTTTRRVATIVVMLILTVALGYGGVGVSQDTGLGQFETDSPEVEKLEFINDHFGDPDEEATTAVQIIVQGENVLDRDTLIGTIELQQDFRDDPIINETLTNNPFTDLASIVATSLIQQERAAAVAEEEAELEAAFDELNQTAQMLVGSFETIRGYQAELNSLENNQSERDELNQSIELTVEEATADLEPQQAAVYEDIVYEVRNLQRALDAYEIDPVSFEEELSIQYDRVSSELLGAEFAELEAWADELEATAAAIPILEPTADEQITAIETTSDERLDSMIERLLGEDGQPGLLRLLPTDFEPGTTTSDARISVVTQLIDEDIVVEGDAPDTIVESQLRMAELVDDRFGDDGFVFGQGIITDELNRSLEDSLALVIPFALLLVIATLMIAYRDLLDIILGVAGIIAVLIWTFGFIGWSGIEFNQIFIAVPVLLIGLSIDYAIHVFMRQREQRSLEEERTSGYAMRLALGGLLVALTWVTATAVFGFLANLVSPVAPIREFGIVSAFGIIAALLIFGLLVPAVKVSLDNFLEGHGINRKKRAFGTGGGRFTSALSVGYRLAKRAPVLVVIVALLLTAGGAYAASDIDTSFEVEDFISDEPAAWTQHFPEVIRPGEYAIKANLQFLDDRFLRQDLEALVLVEGSITEGDTLERLHHGATVAGEQPVTVILADGSPAVTSPLTEMEEVAQNNETFAAVFNEADTTGDGIPDDDLVSVYDAFFAADEQRAMDIIYRTDDGEYEAMLMSVAIRGDATGDEVKTQMRTIAASMDGDGLTATATGQIVVFSIIEGELFETVFESLLVSLVAVFLFLMAVYRITDGSATLGIVTLAPIALAVSLILGTMYLIGMPFNVVTGTITSLTIGLGVAYNIHMSERFRLELHRGQEVWEAMHRSVTGTGGALLGSAATTAGGFGVLALAIIPILQQFGIITALTIIYAFLGSILLLPSLLVLWLKYLGPEELDNGD